MVLAVGAPTVVFACSEAANSDGDASAPRPDASAGVDGDGIDSAIAPPPQHDASEASASDAGVDAAIDATLDSAVCTENGNILDGSFSRDGDADAEEICEYTYSCGMPSGLIALGCNLDYALPDGAPQGLGGLACWLVDEAGCTNDAYAPGADGSIAIRCSPCPGGGGRRPVGLARAEDAWGTSRVGAYLAQMAYEESAAVLAFTRMREELASMGAPAALVRAAETAMDDERRHTRVMARLAKKRGGRDVKARMRSRGKRTMAAIAAENAAEGCVRETYGALLTTWQASHAQDPELRRAFARIAADETRHAELSWALAAWLEPQLDGGARKRVARARARAVTRLRESLREAPAPTVARAAGLPDAEKAAALFTRMCESLLGEA